MVDDKKVLRFDPKQEADYLIERVINLLRQKHYEVRAFPAGGNGRALPTCPVKWYPPPPEDSRNPICVYKFYTRKLTNEEAVLPRANVLNWFTAQFPLYNGNENPPAIHIDFFKLSEDANVDEIHSDLVNSSPNWPIGWSAVATRVAGQDKVMLTLTMIPYEIKELSYIVAKKTIQLLLDASSSCIIVYDHAMTERTVSNQAFLQAFQQKHELVRATNSGLASTHRQHLHMFLQNMRQAQLSWKQFCEEMVGHPDLRCLGDVDLLELEFQDAARSPAVKPNGTVWFTSREDTDLHSCIIYDLVYGHTAVHVLPALFQFSGVNRVRHALNIAMDAFKARDKKPQKRKQKVLLEDDTKEETTEDEQ